MWVNLVGNNFTELHQNYICKTKAKKKITEKYGLENCYI